MTADKPEAGRTCEPSGLYRKFVVERTNGSSGPGGKHEHCDYFVLDWMHDKFAIPAALAYAKACEAEYPELARDLRDRAGAAVAHTEPARKVPLNPAPRPVEQVRSGRGGLLDDMAVMLAGAATLMSDEAATCGQAETWCRLAAELLAQYDRRRDRCNPRPVERCSCDESLRYKAALEHLLAAVRDGRAARLPHDASLPLSRLNCSELDYLDGIARRALALGGETET